MIFKFKIFAAPAASDAASAANKKYFMNDHHWILNTLISSELFICCTNGIFNMQLLKN